MTAIYLLALAVAHGGRLVTFDQRIQPGMVKGCRPEHLVTLRAVRRPGEVLTGVVGNR